MEDDEEVLERDDEDDAMVGFGELEDDLDEGMVAFGDGVCTRPPYTEESSCTISVRAFVPRTAADGVVN